MPTSPNDAIKGAFNDLSKQVETLVNQSLKPALTPRKIKSVDMKTAIYTTVHGGLVVHGSIPLPKDTTLKDLRARVHPVGVLLPTVPLRDPVTRNSIAPGAYLVELRPIVDNAFAFDLIDGGNRTVFSTLATPTDRRRLEKFPLTAPINEGQFSLIDVSVCDLFPPGEGECDVCVSFLIWKECWFVSFPVPE